MRHVSERVSDPTRRREADVPQRRRRLAHEIRAAVTVSGGLIRSGADALLSRIPTVTVQAAPSCAADWTAQPAQFEYLVGLVYELLDAHQDTAELAVELAQDPSGQAHLEYLRALQRTGREVLAHLFIQRGVDTLAAS